MDDFVPHRFSMDGAAHEEMRKCKLFTDEQERSIRMTRDKFEQSRKRQANQIKDYVEQIKFEQDILAQVERAEKIKEASLPMKAYVVNLIKGLYKESLGMFPDEPRLWEAFINFCKKSGLHSDVSTAYEKYLQYHGRNVEIYLKAADYEYREHQNLDKAKSIIRSGLQRHKDNFKLYSKFFHIMLIEASKKSPKMTANSNALLEQTMFVERAITIYQSFRSSIKSVEHMSELLKITEEYSFTKNVQKMIIDDMMNLFTREELAWDILAKRELRGFHSCDFYDTPSQSAEDKSPTEDDDSHSTSTVTKNDANAESSTGFIRRTSKRRIELCYGVYLTAAQTLGTDKMWLLFIDAMYQLSLDESNSQKFKREKLKAALMACHEAGKLSVNHYCLYIDLLKTDGTTDEHLLELFEKGTTLHPDAIKLWEQWMFYYIKRNDEPTVNSIFKRAITTCTESESYPLWRMVLKYYQTRYDLESTLDKIFNEACKRTSPNFISFRIQYLEWNVIIKGIDSTRALYEKIMTYPPPCLELHQRMAILESHALRPDIARCRQCHENAVTDFGKTATDVWINYIKFEWESGDTKQMEVLNQRAIKTLNADLVSSFISEYNLLKI